MTFTLTKTKYSEKSFSLDRNFPFIVRNELTSPPRLLHAKVPASTARTGFDSRFHHHLILWASLSVPAFDVCVDLVLQRCAALNQSLHSLLSRRGCFERMLLFLWYFQQQTDMKISFQGVCSTVTILLSCCYTEIQAADQSLHLTQSQYTDTGSTSPSTNPLTPGAWRGSHWSTNF